MRQRKSLLNYIAGLFDGEGCIHIVKAKPNENLGTVNPTYKLTIEISTTYYPVMEFLKESLGGRIHSRKGDEQRKESWSWQTDAEKALSILKFIAPYLIIKKAEAILGIEYQEGRPRNRAWWKGQTSEDLTRHEFFRGELQRMKRDG